MRKSLFAFAAVGAATLGLAILSTFTTKIGLTKLEALPEQTTRRVFLRTGTSGWANTPYMYSWGGVTKTTPMTHVFDFDSEGSLYFVDITISEVTGFLFLDGSAISAGAPNWSTTDASPWLKSQNAPTLPSWGNSDVYVLSGVWESNPSVSGGNKLSLSASQLSSLLKRYISCSSSSRLYTNSCLAYPQLQADFSIDLFASSGQEVPVFAGGEGNGTTLGQKVTVMKSQYAHYDDDPPEEEEDVIEKTTIAQTYADYISNNVYSIDGAPTIGECSLLVIPVWLTDSSSYVSTSKKSNVLSDIETAYFGSTSATGWHSVKSYYEAESKGALTVSGTVSDWYESGLSMSQVGTYGASETASLVKSASDWYFNQNPGQSRTDFDCDGNGYLDGVMLIYAAPNYQSLNNESYDNLWAYCFWAQQKSHNSVSSPGPNVFFWASYDFMYGSNTASSRTGISYAAGDTSHCNIDAHTYIHEMGHVFGLEDYYDYGSSRLTPAGSFSMQDYNVGGHDPFSTMAFGWSNPYIPTKSCEITIGAFQSTHEVVLLTPSWNAYDSAFDEYLLLELYTPTGLNEFDSTYRYGNAYPQGPSQVGIRLWHIDARLLYFSGSWDASIDHLTSDCAYQSTYKGVKLAFSNTYDDESYGSALGSDYYNYNILQLIRNDTSETYRPESDFSSDDLFVDGDSFEMSAYASQFVKGTKLNNGSALGWSFSLAITPNGADSTATINLVKA